MIFTSPAMPTTRLHLTASIDHADARRCIEVILQDGAGLGPKAVVLVQSSQLRNHEPCGEALAQSLLQQSLAIPPDHGASDGIPGVPGPLPNQADELIEQLLPWIIDHPQQIGLQALSLHALCLLWPHASREERLRLRRQWIASLITRSGGDESFLSRETMQLWNATLPTFSGLDAEESLAVLDGLYSTISAEAAYHKFLSCLTPEVDLTAIAHSLGTLCSRTLCSRFDRHGLTQTMLAGTIAATYFSGHAKPEQSSLLCTQMAHHGWWCHQLAGMSGIKPGSTDSGLSLTEAVEQGDYTAAQRAARQAARDMHLFWNQSYQLLEMLQASPYWPRAVNAIWIVAQRAPHATIPPDDAATLGATMAALSFLSHNEPT